MTRVKCCLNCPDRAVGCHGSCETYKREVEEYRKENAKRKKEQRIELEYQCYMSGRMAKARRKSRRRKR